MDAPALSRNANFRATFVGAGDEVRSRLADTRSYRLMSEPIPLRGVHLQAIPKALARRDAARCTLRRTKTDTR